MNHLKIRCVKRRFCSTQYKVQVRKRGNLATYYCRATSLIDAENRAIAHLGESYLAIISVEKL